MKRKSKRFILSLILGSSLLFSSCGGGGKGDPGGEPAPEIVIPEPTDIPQEIPEPGESDIVPEEGVSVDTKETLKKALRLFQDPMSLEAFDEIVTAYAIEHKISDKAVDGVLKIIIYIYEQILSSGTAASNFEYMNNLFELAKEVRLVDMTLALQYFVDVLTGAESSDSTIFGYVGYEINHVTVADLDKLELIAEQTDDAGFKSTVSEYRERFDNLYVDPSLEENNYSGRQGLHVPKAAIEMMDRLSEADQLGIVRMWEQVVSLVGLDKLQQIFDSVSSLFIGGSEMYYGYSMAKVTIDALMAPEYNLTSMLIDGGSSGGKKLPEILNVISLNDIRSIVSVLLKDERNAQTLLSTATSFVLPAFTTLLDSQTPESKLALDSLIESLKTLEAGSITVVGKLLDGVLALFTEDEFNAIKGYLAEGNYLSLVSLVLPKRFGVANLINGLSASERASITALSNILGFDFNAFLNVVAANVVNISSLDDETSYTALMNITDAAGEIPAAVKEAIGPAFDDGRSGLYCSINFNNYFSDSAYLDVKINASAEDIKSLIAEQNPTFNIYGDEINMYFQYGNIPQGCTVDVAADTSKAGIAALEFTIAFEEFTIVKKMPIKVMDEISSDLVVAVRDNYSMYHASTHLLDYFHTASDGFEFISNFDEYVAAESSYASFDSQYRENGWNVFTSTYVNKDGETKKVYAPYYYIGFDEYGEHATSTTEYHVAGFTSESLNVSGRQYIKITTFVRDYDLYTVSEVQSDYNVIGAGSELPTLPGFFGTAGTYRSVVNGKNIVYHIMDRSNSHLAYTEFNFDLTGLVNEETCQYGAASFNGKLEKRYYADADFTVCGKRYSISIGFSTSIDVTVTNLSYDYQMNTLQFDYNGYRYITNNYIL